MNNVIVRTLCAIAGLLCAGIGIIGMFVPVLPTTPLLFLAGFLFARSSKRLNTWLRGTKAWKTYVNPFLIKQAIPGPTKARILIVSGTVMLISAFAVKDIAGINFVVWFVLELVMLLLLYLMFVRIPTEKNTRSFRSAQSTQNAAE